MRQRLLGVERQLAQVFREFPDLFVGGSPPQFVRPELKNGKGHEWPIIVSETGEMRRAVKAHTARWTPERRREQSERMIKRRAKGRKGGANTGLVTQVHRYLAKHGESSLKDIMKATGAKASSSVISSMHTGFKTGRFVRPSKARYALGPNAQQQEAE